MLDVAYVFGIDKIISCIYPLMLYNLLFIDDVLCCFILIIELI